jgi:hypothetical protein
MAGIVPALETDDQVSPFRQPVDNLTFAFVTPLGTNDNHISHGLQTFIFGSCLRFRFRHRDLKVKSHCHLNTGVWSSDGRKNRYSSQDYPQCRQIERHLTAPAFTEQTSDSAGI